jgi:hypothetical protein
MSAQPTNEECADMFRVMMGEMMRMHPHYLKLKYKFDGLLACVAKPRPDIKMVRHYVNEIAEEFRSNE